MWLSMKRFLENQDVFHRTSFFTETSLLRVNNVVAFIPIVQLKFKYSIQDFIDSCNLFFYFEMEEGGRRFIPMCKCWRQRLKECVLTMCFKVTYYFVFLLFLDHSIYMCTLHPHFPKASYDFSVNTKEGVENLRLGISRAMTEGLYDMYVNEAGTTTTGFHCELTDGRNTWEIQADAFVDVSKFSIDLNDAIHQAAAFGNELMSTIT